MNRRQVLGTLAVVLLIAQVAAAQTYDLSEKSKVGDCRRIHLAMTLAGEMRVTKDNKPIALKLTANAAQDYPERVLAVDPQGVIQKTARMYESTKAAISVENDKSERTLRDERRLVVAQRYKGQSLVYCSGGPMTREEQELASEQFDTLSLPGLLPGKAVAIGESWKVPNDVAQALCLFDGLTTQDLTCKLDEVKNKQARVSVIGAATGIDLGALVKLTIQATYSFDLSSHSIVSVNWKQRDERGQGPANPATTVESSTTVTRTMIDAPTTLSDVALVAVPDGFEPPASMTQLWHHNQLKTPFDLWYSREWQMVGQTGDHIIMRLMDRGDFVAQVTITPWESAKPGEHLSADLFREAMAKTPGWQPDEVVQEGEVATERAHYWIYRISAPGHMDGMKVVQTCYIIAGPGGEQVVLAFTMTPAQAEKLGARDLTLISGLEFPAK
jgi:hypothetical protein